MPKITKHFDEDEFKCKHCGKLPPMWRDEEGELLYCYEEFFGFLESIRTAWGKPMAINSGYRCPEWNRAVGGEPLSVHMFGLAADIGLGSREEVEDFVRVVKDTCDEMRIGYREYLARGETFVHLDKIGRASCRERV